jgi:CheY-like chemotaxis protein/Tfp pilus assembly protein PilZ
MNPESSKILIVDDEPELREILVFDFENLGYEVKEAENAGTALAQLDKNPDIKVIVSDIRMPDGDGVTLLKAVQERKTREPVSLIFVTGFSDLKKEDAFDLGAGGYMTKPFDRRVLSALVERLMISETERWSKGSAVSNGIKLNLSLKSFDFAILNHLLSLGRGGIFVATKESALIEGSVVNFAIKFQEGKPENIQGTGVVRWVRPVGSGSILPGIGLEFLFLEDKSKDFILNVGNGRNKCAFIPKN